MAEAVRGGHGARPVPVIWLVTVLVLAGSAVPSEPGADEGFPVESVPEVSARPAEPAPAPTPVGKSPGRAVLLSLAIPGGGQVYTGHWWKASLIAPTEVTLAVLAARDHRHAGAARQTGDTTRYLVLCDRRNTLLFFTGTVLVYSMADAWVSARMHAFDRQMEFAIGPGRAGLNVGF
ncbi:MAG TPA: hypothetical protein ENN51_01425 [candidate division WOR-3 bacterium]|uniref:DUF5683 domain-containing protein n=1 Tax=candidate division WOR-3 bacterium TaxID=2052148 RepID=A0A7V0T4D4_UNCW3|nr:hypothetical protein [candidate division WOR-3 bacterium]